MAEYSEMDRILSRYFDGSICAEELSKLEAKLLADGEFANHVSRTCLMHRQVSELLTETKLHALMDNFVTGSRTLPKDAVLQFTSADVRSKNASLLQPALLGRGRRNRLRSLVGWGTIAASALALAAWGVHSRKSSNGVGTTADASKTVPVQDTSAARQIVATLTQVDDCVWADNAPTLHHGQQLMKGDQVALSLRHGEGDI